MADRVDVEFLSRRVHEFATLIRVNKQPLTTLDAAIGDGINMDRGMTAVLATLNSTPPNSPTALLKQVGVTLVSVVGGAAGVLYGTFFVRTAIAAAAYPDGIDADGFSKVIQTGIDAVAQRGRAESGDKTMYDALAPAVRTLHASLASGATLVNALCQAAKSAAAGRHHTTGMRARKGCASYLGERSVGHQDPGATSAALLITALTIPATKTVGTACECS